MTSLQMIVNNIGNQIEVELSPRCGTLSLDDEDVNKLKGKPNNHINLNCAMGCHRATLRYEAADPQYSSIASGFGMQSIGAGVFSSFKQEHTPNPLHEITLT